MLYEFYGTECPHCQRMREVVDEVEKEQGVVFERKEVWHNDENRKFFDLCDKGNCGGVPFFYNDANGKWICGEVSKDDFTEFLK